MEQIVGVFGDLKNTSRKITPIVFAVAILFSAVLNWSGGYGHSEYGYTFWDGIETNMLFYVLILAGAIIVGILLTVIVNKYSDGQELIISEGQIIGKAAWGKIVNTIPEKVSSVKNEGTDKLIISVGVADYIFVKVKNLDDLIAAIEKARMKNQLDCRIKGSLDDLKKLKELMDAGVISELDYDIKKKEILNQ